MELGFVNRTEELRLLDEHAAEGGLLVVIGRCSKTMRQPLKQLEARYRQTTLSRSRPHARFEVLDAAALRLLG